MDTKGNSISFVVCLLLTVFLLASSGWAAEGDPDRPAFSYPSGTMDMEEGWEQKPIRYREGEGDADLSVIVNQQVAPALLSFVEEFGRQKGIRMEIAIGTCGMSAGELARKEVDIGGFCCPPGEIDRLPGLKFHTLGITPLLLLVHPGNPVRDVSRKEARMLFSGQISNWSEVGGPDLSVTPLGMLHCKKRPGHWRLILDNADLFSPLFHVTGNIEDTLSVVSATPGGVGFEIMMNIIHFGHQDKVRALWLDGNDPMDLKRLMAADYPYYRTMNVTTWEGEHMRNPHAEELVQYLMEKVEKLDPSQGIIPASALREAGWKFNDNELTGEPR